MINNESCKLQILDTGGDKELTILRNQWIRDGKGFLLVYSITSKSSFSLVKQLHDQIRHAKETESPMSIPIVLVGNKSDLSERQVSLEEGHAFAEKLGCKFFEMSAKEDTHTTVESLFYCAAGQLEQLRRSRQSLETWRNDGTDLQDGLLGKLPWVDVWNLVCSFFQCSSSRK
jgi:GTPase KRas protein